MAEEYTQYDGLGDLFGSPQDSSTKVTVKGGRTPSGSPDAAAAETKYYEQQIAGAEYARYRLGDIKDAYRGSKTLWQAIKQHRQRELEITDSNSMIALMAYIDTHDTNALNLYFQNEEQGRRQREIATTEQWAEDTANNPNAPESSKRIARAIAAKLLKPYAIETDLAQFAQFQAGSESSAVAESQRTVAENESLAGYQKAIIEIKQRQVQAENDFYEKLLLARVSTGKADPVVDQILSKRWNEFGGNKEMEQISQQILKQ